MRTYNTNAILRASLLAAAVSGAVVLAPSSLLDRRATAGTYNNENAIRLSGVVRDFQNTHPDFDAAVQEAAGLHSGLLSAKIGDNGLPVYDGAGTLIVDPAKDNSGRNIAPLLANPGLTNTVKFTISNGRVIPSESFAAGISVLGVAIESMPVTSRLRVGSQTIDPFGPFTNPKTGNLNDANNPRHYVVPGTHAAGTPVTIVGRSWSGSGKNASAHMTADTNVNSPQVKVLRNGSVVPEIKPYANQGTISSFLTGYIDPATNTVTIADNQVIYLFELYTTNLKSVYADFQDLVVLLTLARGEQAFGPETGETMCGPTDDKVAITDPSQKTGAITSPDTFQEWFTDIPGLNMSGTAPLDLIPDGDKWVFDDQTDPLYSRLGGFYPADNRLFGPAGHNEDFTFQIDATFTYSASMNQYFQALSDAEIWVFIDGKLAIDLGGFHGVMDQRIDLSRLCLTDGQTYNFQFFMASRNAPQNRLRLETNIQFASSPRPVAVMAPVD